MVTALVIEDSRTDRERLTNYLHQSGIKVINVESSEEAMQQVQDALPDVVLVDIVLPGKSGFEFCRHLKTDAYTQGIPIVICSSKSTDADKLWGTMLGADAHLSKPVDPTQLAATLHKVMN